MVLESSNGDPSGASVSTAAVSTAAVSTGAASTAAASTAAASTAAASTGAASTVGEGQKVDAARPRNSSDAADSSQQEAGVRDVDVRRSAMDMLARREHTRQELTEKLSRKFDDAPAGMISTALDRLQDEGLQSDRRMADAFTRARIRRGQGPLRIRMELRQKGLGDTMIDEALASASLDGEPLDWAALATEVAERKYANLADASTDMKFRGKVARFLQQRGFSFEQISHLF